MTNESPLPRRHTTSFQRVIDVDTTSCVYWVKIKKNAFYFTLKALFFLKIFKFLFLTVWSCRKNDSVRKLRLNSKFMTSHPG